MGDNFSADIIHKKYGSILSFNREKFYSYVEIFNHQSEGTDAPPNAVMPSQLSPAVFIKSLLCKFENIHQEVIDHHIKYGHEMATG
jgi:hypothetical protein